MSFYYEESVRSADRYKPPSSTERPSYSHSYETSSHQPAAKRSGAEMSGYGQSVYSDDLRRGNLYSRRDSSSKPEREAYFEESRRSLYEEKRPETFSSKVDYTKDVVDKSWSQPSEYVGSQIGRAIRGEVGGSSSSYRNSLSQNDLSYAGEIRSSKPSQFSILSDSLPRAQDGHAGQSLNRSDDERLLQSLSRSQPMSHSLKESFPSVSRDLYAGEPVAKRQLTDTAHSRLALLDEQLQQRERMLVSRSQALALVPERELFFIQNKPEIPSLLGLDLQSRELQIREQLLTERIREQMLQRSMNQVGVGILDFPSQRTPHVGHVAKTPNAFRQSTPFRGESASQFPVSPWVDPSIPVALSGDQLMQRGRQQPLMHLNDPNRRKRRARDEDGVPWVTGEVRSAIAYRDKLRDTANASEAPDAWERFRQQRDVVNKLLRANKRAFDEDPKQFVTRHGKQYVAPEWSNYMNHQKTRGPAVKRPPGPDRHETPPDKKFRGTSERDPSNAGTVPWMTDELKKEKEMQVKLRDAAVLTKDEEDWKKFREQRSKVQKMWRDLKANYYKNNKETSDKTERPTNQKARATDESYDDVEWLNYGSEKQKSLAEKPWMTAELRKLIEQKVMLELHAHRSNDPEVWDVFSVTQNRVTGLYRRLKNKYLKDQESKDKDAAATSAEGAKEKDDSKTDADGKTGETASTAEESKTEAAAPKSEETQDQATDEKSGEKQDDKEITKPQDNKPAKENGETVEHGRAGWFTPEIGVEMAVRTKMKETADESGLPEDWQALAVQRKKVQAMIRDAKTKFAIERKKNRPLSDGKPKPSDTADLDYENYKEVDEVEGGADRDEELDALESQPWLTDAHRELIERKNKLLKRAMYTQDDKAWTDYRKQRNRLLNILKGVRLTHEAQKTMNRELNPRTPWISQLIKKQVILKRQLELIAFRSNDPEAWRMFKMQKAKTDKMTREAKEEYHAGQAKAKKAISDAAKSSDAKTDAAENKDKKASDGKPESSDTKTSVAKREDDDDGKKGSDAKNSPAKKDDDKKKDSDATSNLTKKEDTGKKDPAANSSDTKKEVKKNDSSTKKDDVKKKESDTNGSATKKDGEKYVYSRNRRSSSYVKKADSTKEKVVKKAPTAGSDLELSDFELDD